MTDKQMIKLNELTEISQELGLYEQCPYMGDDKRCKAHLNEVFWWKCYEFDNCLYKKYKAKEQECEELKEDYATAKSMYDLCQSDFMELAKIKDNYKQTLADIKEIAEKLTDDYGHKVSNAKIILQKISEVEQ